MSRQKCQEKGTKKTHRKTKSKETRKPVFSLRWLVSSSLLSLHSHKAMQMMQNPGAMQVPSTEGSISSVIICCAVVLLLLSLRKLFCCLLKKAFSTTSTPSLSLSRARPRPCSSRHSSSRHSSSRHGAQASATNKQHSKKKVSPPLFLSSPCICRASKSCNLLKRSN